MSFEVYLIGSRTWMVRDMGCCECFRPFLWKKDARMVMAPHGHKKIVCVSCSEKYGSSFPAFKPI